MTIRRIPAGFTKHVKVKNTACISAGKERKKIKKSSARKTSAKVRVTCGYSCGDEIRRKYLMSKVNRRKILRNSCGLISAGKSAGKTRVSSSV